MKTMTPLYETFFSTHPEEAARLLESFSMAEIFRVISQTQPKNIAHLLSNMSPPLASDVLLRLDREVLVRAVPEFSPTILANLTARIDPEQQTAFLKRIPQTVVKELTAFLEYPPNAVGSLMDPRVLALSEDMLVEQALAQIRARGSREMHEVYVIDRNHKLVGSVPLRDLLITSPDERLQAIMERDLLTIHPLEQRDHIVGLFNERKLFTFRSRI
ncbi:MAG: CBS domain-containing protein [Nitrospirales bacterium]|nr:CBS domain-containing protein [Nitrospirales bacterium]